METAKKRLLVFKRRAGPLLQHNRTGGGHMKMRAPNRAPAEWRPVVDDDFVSFGIKNLVLVKRGIDAKPIPTSRVGCLSDSVKGSSEKLEFADSAVRPEPQGVRRRLSRNKEKDAMFSVFGNASADHRHGRDEVERVSNPRQKNVERLLSRVAGQRASGVLT